MEWNPENLKKKNDLRSRMMSARKALTVEEVAECSRAIRKRVLETPEVRGAFSIFIYVSFGKEVDTHALIRELLKQGKTILVPQIVGEGLMEAHRLARQEDLQPGKFGILAPETPDPFPDTPNLTICPGVAFSLQGDRLGRGKAYYDRYLEKHSGTFPIGLSYEFQVFDEIPVSAKDRRVHLIITEKRILRISS